LELVDLVALAGMRTGHDLGGSARAILAVVRLAERSVTEGLVHPSLEFHDGSWHAMWGPTLDETVLSMLDAVVAALPAACSDAFDGDADATVHDLYAFAVDQLARRRLREAGVRLDATLWGRTSGTLDLFLAGLAAEDSSLPRNPGYAALETRISSWVDSGLARRSTAPWEVTLRLDEHRHGDGESTTTLAPWLHAGDDPTLTLPAELLWQGRGDVFAFVRASDPRRDLARKLDEIDPILAQGGIAFDLEQPGAVEIDPAAVRFLLQEAAPRLEARGVVLLLPSEWVGGTGRLRVNLVARRPSESFRSSGLLGASALAQFDWKLALGDTVLDERELRELAAAKEPLIRAGGRWHALRRGDVERALRFLDRRRADSGAVSIVDLVRAVSGLDAEEAGLEHGEVTLDPVLAQLLQGDDERRFNALPTPTGMALPLFPFQERGHGWLRMLGDLGVGAILADDMGLGKTVQAIAMLVSEREEIPARRLGPTLVVCPMSVARQWVRELERFAPSLDVHLHHGAQRLRGDAFLDVARDADVVVTSYDVATRNAELMAEIEWDRLLLDEAQDVKNALTKRARALRSLRARRRVAMTGTPVENNLGDLWALMDVVNPGLLGSRERFERSFGRPIEQAGDVRALERLREIVHPFVLRRAKDAPEVDLELPPLTVTKEMCSLTAEQVTLYRATVDRWLPRIEEHERTFDRRGAVLAMLGQLKQVCNHPEMVLPTGLALHGRSGKLDRLLELLTEMPAADKAIVFTQYPGFERLVTHVSETLGVAVGFFHGGLGARRREELLHAFEREDGPRVMVVSLRAGGRGLNLPAANHVFHFDRWWNPAVEQQATDRAYRFGQRKPVFVHSMICRATLEERIDELLESKRELAEKVVATRTDDWLGELDLDTIRRAVALSPDLEAGT
ncbi:MAG: DEAD/DEAH box helicase, partial [Actinobacteria bacterium]|nr:DEAD/DEAH box helicase [Actinomycetota bacterium]